MRRPDHAATRLRRSVFRLSVSAGGGSSPSSALSSRSWRRSKWVMETRHQRSAARIMVANTSFIAAFSSGKPADHLGTPAGYQRTFPAAVLSAIHRVPVRAPHPGPHHQPGRALLRRRTACFADDLHAPVISRSAAARGRVQGGGVISRDLSDVEVEYLFVDAVSVISETADLEERKKSVQQASLSRRAGTAPSSCSPTVSTGRSYRPRPPKWVRMKRGARPSSCRSSSPDLGGE